MFRRSAWLLSILAAASPLVGQSAGSGCATFKPKLVFEDTTNGMRVIYHVPNVEGISAAWIEVWDRPRRLFRTVGSVKTDGQILWEPDDPYPTTPEMLSLAIYDAELPEFCIDYPCSGPSFGSNVSPVVVGNTTSESSGNAKLEGPPIRLEEGGDVTDVIATGRDLPPDMKVILIEKDDTTADYRWIFRDYLNTQAIDLRHIKVTVPLGYLLKPGVYGLVGQDASFEMDANALSKLTPEQELYVASKDSPVISSVEPPSVRSDAVKRDDVEVTLRGRGFTTKSLAVFGTASTLEMGLGGGDADFVSSQELQAKIPYYLLTVGPFASNEPIRVWVTDDDTLKVSEPVEIQVSPASSQKVAPKAAAINSVTPFLIPLMDAHSPKYQLVEIEGENFRPDDRVEAVRDPDHPGDYSPLKTEFISDTKLRAWLPREFWRKHQLSYRLLLKTVAGVCATEVFDEEN